MPRRPKCRRVAFMPQVTYFKPAGIKLVGLEEVQMSVEEAEALRLKDLEGLEQGQAAVKMNVSRPTFQRVLASARQKVSDTLLNGKALKIEGGNFEMTSHHFRCAGNHKWHISSDVAAEGLPVFCPTCNSKDIVEVTPATPVYGRHHGGRKGSAKLPEQ